MSSTNSKGQIAHMYKDKKSTGAERSRIGNNHQVENFHVATHGDVGSKKKWRRRNKKKRKINTMVCFGKYYSKGDNKNDEEIVINMEKVMNKTFYYNFYISKATKRSNPNLLELKPLFDDNNIHMINIIDSGLEIINETNGAIMTRDDYPVFLLVPRLSAITKNNNSRADYDNLMWLLNNHSNVNIRGKKHTGHSTQYATAGAHSSNFRKGIHIKKLHADIHKLHEPYLQKWLQRAKEFAKQYLPFGLLSGLQEAKFLVNDETCYENEIKGDTLQTNESVYASLATSYNYIAPAHVDNDSFLSCLFVTIDMTQYNKQVLYEEEMDECVYFVFPDYNKAVALRPGDVLFFNPLMRHCLSQRCLKYIDNQILSTTFYLNTKTFSGNDATKPINYDKLK